jgi:Zn-finger nucleic acid-binding protein
VPSCPRCPGAELTAHRSEAVELDLCESCGGVWLDEGEWLAVMGVTRDVAPPVSLSLDPRPRCPACSTPMQPFGLEQAAHIEVDVCRDCGGTWLDAYELGQVQVAIAAAREARLADAHGAPDPSVPASPRGRSHVRAAFTRDPAEAMTFLEALADTWRTLWRR